MDLDLKKLAALRTSGRAFLSVFLAGPQSVADLEKRLSKVHRVLKGGGPEKDEREYFTENVAVLWEYLSQNPLRSGSLCIYACRGIGFFQAIPLLEPVKDIVRIDSSPYIRPLAELHDDYGTVAVVVADNKKARIFLVSSFVAGSEEVIKGHVKNHVKVGGWSQQRYERRRDKQLEQYVHDIGQALVKLDQEERIAQVLLVGSKEVLHLVHNKLPKELQARVMEKNLDLGRGEGTLNRELMVLLAEEEHHSQEDYWERIRVEYLEGGLAVTGIEDVLRAAIERRVEKGIVNRTFHPRGRRCRNCHTLNAGMVEACRVCGSPSLFDVSLINEILDMLIQADAELHFADPIPGLAAAGEIAALLRY